MDNARYQRCIAVMEYARKYGVELVFLPSYSPNLNFIERLWKFAKKNALNSRYYGNFDLFKKGIDDYLKNVGMRFKNEVESLMTLKFHIVYNEIL
jgi:transposase